MRRRNTRPAARIRRTRRQVSGRLRRASGEANARAGAARKRGAPRARTLYPPPPPDTQLSVPDIALAPRTADLAAGPARVLVLPTPTPQVVAFRASLRTAPDLAADEDIAQGLVADLLDKGTRRRDRHAIADALDGRGARLSFYADGLRLGFAGRVLAEDLPDVLALAAEMLAEPAFDADEVQKAKRQAEAAVRQSRESTGAMASGALARRLYGTAHPNYVHAPDAESARLAALGADDLAAYHAAHVGADDFTLVAVGDVTPEAAAEAVARAFGDLPSHGRTARYDAEARSQPPAREDVPMPDRPNLDVRLGHAVGMRRTDDAFLALHTGVFALGGNFAGRLMQTIRDEQGLTYGISAGLVGFAAEHDGDVRVSVGLSGPDLERGIAAVRAEVARFVADGIAPEALATAQTTLAGQHVTAMATTSGLAARLLVNAERGFDVAYLDRYPDLVRALTPEAVTDALRTHVRPDDFHVTVAGTIPPPA